MVGPAPATWAVEPGDARAFELVPGLWQLRLPTPWPHMSHVNCYAVDRPDGGLVLIDQGCGGHPTNWETMERALGLAGRRVDDLRELVITHFHSDHMGLAGPLAAQTGATVSAHPAHEHFFHCVRDPEGVYEERRAFGREHGVPQAWLEAVSTLAEELDGVESPPQPDRALVDGEVVETVLGPLEVLETPGHAPSHICLYAREQRLLFVADLVSPIFMSYGDWGYTPDPTGEFRASVEKIADLDVALALPGHGRPTADFGALIERYRSGFEEREAFVAAASGSAWEISQALFGETDYASMAVWNFVETAGYLNHLEGRMPGARRRRR